MTSLILTHTSEEASTDATGTFFQQELPVPQGPPFFTLHSYFTVVGVAQLWLPGAFQSFIGHFPQSDLSLLLTNQSMWRSAPVARRGWDKSGKGDQKGDSCSSVVTVNEYKGGPEPYQNKRS